MARSRGAALLLVVLILLRGIAALQVTPNSPCAALCIDDQSLDPSDPNSSNTKNSDMVCADADYTKSQAGTKWQGCMSCLQNSTFSQGAENDQMWFLYNLRYNVDYCLFGYPNATGVGTSPCITSTACGPLEVALETGNLTAQNLDEFGYCSADGGAMSSSAINKCLACISAGGENAYMSNYMVALEAGCVQQPGPGHAVGLNGSIFSPTVIGIITPSNGTTAAQSPSQSVSVTVIVPVVIGAIVLIAAVAGCIFVCRRRRRNRDHPPRGWRHNRKSSLSFRCQTHLEPQTPKFFGSDADDAAMDEMTYAHTKQNSISDLMATAERPSLYTKESFATYSENGDTVVDDDSASTRRAITSRRPAQQVQTVLPAYPSSVRHSSSGSAFAFSPESYGSPASAVSARSTTHMLPSHRPYNPRDHIGGGSGMRGPGSQFSSPLTGSTTSPLLNQRSWPTPMQVGGATFTPALPPSSTFRVPAAQIQHHQQQQQQMQSQAQNQNQPQQQARPGLNFSKPAPRESAAFPFPVPPPPPLPHKMVTKNTVVLQTPSPEALKKKGKSVDLGRGGLQIAPPVQEETVKLSFAPPPGKKVR